jgi:outer membrane lipoprotein carrier protein
MKRLVPLLALALLPQAGMADSIEELKSLLRETLTARARFAQMVLDKDLKVLQQSVGNMAFARPGRFRWEYEKPYEQVIVGDGARLWIYDRDLNQVTVRKLEGALGSSPAALLAGSSEIERGYTLSKVDTTEQGLNWLEAVPKARDTVFDSIRLGFSKAGLEAMELHDQFGQVTVIKFSAMQRNEELSADLFRFSPPAGADVINE